MAPSLHSLPSSTTCPHCNSPSIHTDYPTGDTLCTSCGIVLSSHHLSLAPEWINYEGDDAVASQNKQRCGAPVDESQWRGGLMPTTLGKVPYLKTSTSEEARRLGGIRRTLMKTHAIVESMMDKEWKERYDAVVLESRVRKAKFERGEEVEELNGVTCGGDYEEIMGQDDRLTSLTPLRDRKWVLSDAILLYGSLDEVSIHLSREEGWTDVSLEKERKTLFKSLDAASRSSAAKLYTAFSLLYRAASKLELDRILSDISKWLVEYAKKRELKVKGLSRDNTSDYTLSLLNYQESKKKMDLHKMKQYGALCSAIIYLAAKRNGKGRTLAEICEAFGVVRCADGEEEEPLVRPKYCSKAMGELRSALPSVVLPAAAASASSAASSKSTDCVTSSTASMKQEDSSTMSTPIKSESRASFNEGAPSIVSLSSTSSLGPVSETSNHNIINDDISVSSNVAQSSENEAIADLTSRLAGSLNLPPFAIESAAAIAVQCSNDTAISTPAAKRGRQIRPPIRRGKGNSSLFIKNTSGKRSIGVGAALKKEVSSDVIAASSILLVCMAGQKMQTLARQAVQGHRDNLAAENSTISQEDESDNQIGTLSSPFDDLANEMSAINEVPEQTASIDDGISAPAAAATAVKQNPSSIESWIAWNHQPAWHRQVSQIEQCSGVSSKTIISYYSNVLHPRRAYYLNVAKKKLGNSPEHEMVHSRKRFKTEHGTSQSQPHEVAVLLQNITAAAPMLSIRGL
ncbi:hypothetical protein ACHAXN_000715 [Cyclotella atomus]